MGANHDNQLELFINREQVVLVSNGDSTCCDFCLNHFLANIFRPFLYEHFADVSLLKLNSVDPRFSDVLIVGLPHSKD